MKVYVYVKNDKYQLPIAVADTQRELSRMLKKCPQRAKLSLHGQKKNPDTKRKHLILEVNI